MDNIGQLRRDEITDYAQDINDYTQELVINENVDLNYEFYDQCLRKEITPDNIYYLRFKIRQRPDSLQKFIITLKNSGITDKDIEEIRTYEVKQGTEDSYNIFELIFTPNKTYNQIVFKLSRTALDFTIRDEEGRNGRIMDVEILDFQILKNVISYLISTNKFPNLTTIKKIGIQGPPGLIFTIDGEEMRIGRSGIYELYNEDIKMSYIGFVLKDSLFTQNGKDFFIMDFKY